MNSLPVYRFLAVCAFFSVEIAAWTSTHTPQLRSCRSATQRRLSMLRAVQGADIEQPPVEESSNESSSSSAVEAPSPTSSSVPGRGKVNEIDFCIAPADVSLSRSYDIASETGVAASEAPLSMTRALNNASNRAVRRILLARSWPSAEALNESLRQVMAAEKQRTAARVTGKAVSESAAAVDDSVEPGAKCPVPRPILNILTRSFNRNRNKDKNSPASETIPQSESGPGPVPMPRSRTDAEYVADQMKAFRERYGDLPGYMFAEEYLESILSLATSGVESPRVDEIMESGVYDEAYKRVVSVLKSVGAVFQPDPATGRTGIASKLVNQNICLSLMDKIQMKHDLKSSLSGTENNEGLEVVSKAAVEDGVVEPKKDGAYELTPEDLGGVLLSAEEPTMTRGLNSLANIAQRALLFGGDQELLVLAETLDADRAPFVERWYPNTGGVKEGASLEEETRPGVQFLNCLVTLLRDCYIKGMVTNLNPPLPLIKSYATAYERLVASAVELGSGYLKPDVSIENLTNYKARNAQEELGKFAVWETQFRKGMPKNDVSKYPTDLEGKWSVKDEISGETIGMTTVNFGPEGKVQVAPPLEGLRWRLDPGPTHLDTCTFQVLSNDGTILQYRGFIDRGARLESRFSKRPTKIRGSVMFQMREGGSVDFYKDMLPINYKTGTTKFVMTKIMDGETQ
jgi:hypothetical protein